MQYKGMEEGLAMPTPGENGVFSVQVKLPEGLECEQCVFQVIWERLAESFNVNLLLS